ncbi:hypothetical protein [Paracoccus aminophilus]|uniref:Uncharacterized protein n=1 Tax=Paracoccus aminophilus JCM 7686 TaxID=1367847 RepID=S5XMY4_PARAH|nr:hypothetical protein [Paracoccus aminophilus]AGT08639.1 hypothetical protein JCM7686_1538 [Paracoccus aminophilus JCM 7686]
MPKLIRLYLKSIALGVALALAFTALLIGFDIAGLRALVFGTKGGFIAAIMLFTFHSLLFSGVQFAYAVMAMAEDDHPNTGLRQTAGQLLYWAVTPVGRKRD